MSQPPSVSQVECFLNIPVKNHKLFLNNYPKSFTGKEAVNYIITSFKLTEHFAIEFANYLIRGDIIEPLNNRFNTNFANKSNYIYCICDKKKHNLFWLDDKPKQLLKSSDLYLSTSIINRKKRIKDASLSSILRKSKSSSISLNIKILHTIGKQLCSNFENEGIFTININDKTYIFIFSPEYNQIVLEDKEYFIKKYEQHSSYIDLLFNHLKFSEFSDSEYKLQLYYERLIQEKFTKDRVTDIYRPIIIDIIKYELDDINNQCRSDKSNGLSSIDISEFFKQCIMKILSSIFFGFDILSHTKYNKLGKYLAGIIITKGKLKGISQTKYKKRYKYMIKTIGEIIQERQLRKSKTRIDTSRRDSDNSNSINSNDILIDYINILDILLNASTILDPLNPEEISISVSHDVISHTILSIISHIHYPTSSMLSWAINYIYDNSNKNNNDLQRLLMLEIDKISGTQKLYEPTTILSNSPVLTGILKESLRLCTPIPGIIRESTKSCSLGDYYIRNNSTIIISTIGTHLNSKLWDKPKKFDPFRFSTKAKKPVEPYSYIPWSGGSHYCNSGMEFSLAIGRIFLFMILSRFELKISQKLNIKDEEENYLFPNGLVVNFSLCKARRNSSFVKSLSHSNSHKIIKKRPDKERAWHGLRTMIQQKEYRLFVVAGTREQNGTTATIATKFCEKAAEFYFKLGNSPYPPDDILPLLQTPESEDFLILAICMATYQGKPSPNSREFIRWLEDCTCYIQQGKTSLKKLLKHVNYFVFGCGDSAWSNNYQVVPRFVDDTLSLLGANRIADMGTFDASNDDLYDAYSSYFKCLAPRLMHSLPEIGNRKLRDVDSSALMGSVQIEPQQQSASIKMEFVGDLSDESIKIPKELPSVKTKGIYKCRVIKISGNKLSTTSSFIKSSRVLTKSESSESSSNQNSLSSSTGEKIKYKSLEVHLEVLQELKYKAGDSILIYPQIHDSVLYQFFSLYTDYDQDMIVQWTCNKVNLQSTKRQFHLPLNIPVTLGNIFRNLVDITALPTRQFLMNLSTIVENPIHQNMLNEYATDIGKYQQWIKSKPSLRLVDVLTSFPIKNSSLDRLLEFLPLLQPKSYPILSSWDYHTNYISIFISDSTSHNPTLSYLLQLQASNERNPSIHVSLRQGEHLSLDPIGDKENRALLMISKGVSIAPYISLLFEIAHKGISVKAMLFHCVGPNESKKNFILKRSIRRLQKLGVLEHVNLFNSTQLTTILEDNQINLWEYINNLNCLTYLAGCNGATLSDILEGFTKIIQNQCTPLVFRGSREYADAYLTQLRQAGRLEECWF